MTIPSFFIEPANYANDVEDLHAIRHVVFVEEQQIPAEVEFDRLDEHCYHFLVRDAQYQPIATGRLSPEGRIGRMAVLKDWRRQGVGSALLRALIDKGISLGLPEVFVHAQAAATAFYERQGFISQGETFLESDILHQHMCKTLQPMEKPQRNVSTIHRPSVESTSLDSLESTIDATMTLIGEARRKICIVSRDLDYSLFGQAQVKEALRQLAVQQHQTVIQIIIQDPVAVQSQGHPLLELIQKLTSYFLLRTPVEDEDLQYASAFIINDNNGYLFRPLGNRYEGHWSPNLPARHRPLAEEFDRVWQRSRPCSEFRALGL